MLLTVLTKPGRKNAKLSWDGDTLTAAVKAPAKEGKANQELVRTLAKFFGVAKSQVEIKSGLTSRQKVVRIDLDPAAVQRQLDTVKPPTQDRLLP
ncbi:MAG: DUF167 domain-containing protein [Patescibacteria group bacterium]|nr:DUF167 domain-containing protein [Patescibacteria group bacterium]